MSALEQGKGRRHGLRHQAAVGREFAFARMGKLPFAATANGTAGKRHIAARFWPKVQGRHWPARGLTHISPQEELA